ncbi:Fluffing protein [Escherichia coli]|uniref:Fluffing protein n=1 Tax=Escherichia coli TaxID=562 RepID=A0A485JEP2_ECOLX|nr:Fluffing protein [Escherichia coli]
MLAGKANDTLLAGGTMNNLGGEDSDTIVENGSTYRLGTDVFSSTVPVRRKTCPLMWVVGLKCMPVRWKMR